MRGPRADSGASEAAPNRPAARLHVLIARRARQAVVLRRGPSKVTLLSKWDLGSDRLVHGQWLKGHVYEHRCDLSPSGEYLVVFAGKHRGPVPTWTAVSRPPFFSALVTFPNAFGAWGGGGLFDSEYSLRVNHRPELIPLEGSPRPRRFHVSRLNDGLHLGEDDPIRHLRPSRDGWVLADDGVAVKHPFGSRLWLEYTTPRVYRRAHPKRRGAWLEQRLMGISERNGGWYVFEHGVVFDEGERAELGRSDWADWDHNGDLLWAQKGCLYRAHLGRGSVELTHPALVADLNPLTFSRVAPTPAALA